MVYHQDDDEQDDIHVIQTRDPYINNLATIFREAGEEITIFRRGKEERLEKLLEAKQTFQKLTDECQGTAARIFLLSDTYRILTYALEDIKEIGRINEVSTLQEHLRDYNKRIQKFEELNEEEQKEIGDFLSQIGFVYGAHAPGIKPIY